MRINFKKLCMGLYLFPFIPIFLVSSELAIDIYTIIKVILGVFGMGMVIFVWKEYRMELFLWGGYSFAFLLPYLYTGTISVQQILLKTYSIGSTTVLIYLCYKEMDKLVDVIYYIAKVVLALYLCFKFAYFIFGKYDIPILYNNRNAEQTYFTFVIGAIVLYINYYKKDWNARSALMIAISFWGMLVSNSATAIFSCAAGILILFLYKKLNVLFLIISYGVAFFVLAIIHATDNSVVKVILKVLEKKDTFTNRYWRWNFSLNQFKISPWIGNGELEQAAGKYSGYPVEYFNPHNAFLYILVFSGIIGMFFCALIVWKVRKCREQYFLVVLGMLLVTGLMESNLGPSSFVFVLFMVIAMLEQRKIKQESS